LFTEVGTQAEAERRIIEMKRKRLRMETTPRPPRLRVQERKIFSDVAIYLLGLAEMTGLDLQDEIEAKMTKNAASVYRRLPNGALAKSSGEVG
jgi:hypothetical protein